jgi:LacI family transcriptional regulator
MVTIQDVARKAGVAPITVSRVVNNSGYVAHAVRVRVETAVAELGYVPNAVARSLRSRRSNTLALVLTDITNPFFTTVARGVEDAANQAGVMVILCNTDEQEDKEQAYLQLLLQKRVDGVLLVPTSHTADSVRVIRQYGTAVVVLDRRVQDVDVDVVRCDSEQGAYALGCLLLSLGHRQFAVLAGPPGISTSEDRIQGFRRALREVGAQGYCQVYHGEFTQASGTAMTHAAMAIEARPTAIFAANNFLTIGALAALHEAAIRVPEEVALVGFDDLPAPLVTFPFLTVVAQPAYEMGKTAVELLLRRLKEGTESEYREIILDSELMIRASSGGQRS